MDVYGWTGRQWRRILEEEEIVFSLKRNRSSRFDKEAILSSSENSSAYFNVMNHLSAIQLEKPSILRLSILLRRQFTVGKSVNTFDLRINAGNQLQVVIYKNG